MGLLVTMLTDVVRGTVNPAMKEKAVIIKSVNPDYMDGIVISGVSAKTTNLVTGRPETAQAHVKKDGVGRSVTGEMSAYIQNMMKKKKVQSLGNQKALGSGLLWDLAPLFS